MNHIAEIASTLGGRDTEYRMLHLWVEKQLGKPKICVLCKTTSAKRFEWANISGEYIKDTSDWRRLCPSCHRREQYIGYCKHGHEMTPENTYAHPKGINICKTCRNRWISRLPRENRVCKQCCLVFLAFKSRKTKFCSQRCAALTNKNWEYRNEQ